MPITELYTYPNSPEKLVFWGFTHMTHHRDIIRLIFESTGEVLDEWIMDPFDPFHDKAELADWLHSHQEMHDQMNKSLGIDGHALSDVDWSSRDEMATWLNNHAQEHVLAGDILNLG